MVRRLCCCAVALWVTAAAARASVYSVPLPGLKGIYTTQVDQRYQIDGPVDVQFALFAMKLPVDLGQEFERIDSIYLDLKGTVAPGLWDVSYMNADMSGPVQIERYPAMHFLLIPGASERSGAGMGELLEDGAFNTRIQLQQIFAKEPIWLDGANFTFYLTGPVSSGYTMYGQIVPAVVEIESAGLVIEGTVVPEPCAGMLLLPLALVSLRRRR